MIIDAHNSIIPWDEKACQILFPKKFLNLFYPCSHENILREMDELNIDRLITWIVATRPELSTLCNDWTARIRDRNPDRLIGFCSVHPAQLEEALKEVERAVSDLGLSGLKLHPQVQGISMADPKLLAIVQEAKRLSLPVVLHVDPPSWEGDQFLEKERSIEQGPVQLIPEDVMDTGESDLSNPRHLKEVISVYPSNKVMAAHMGGCLVREVIESKISFQTTGASKRTIEWACKNLGVQRVIFGTDFPFFKMGEELEKVRAAALSTEEREKVLSGNILSILEN